MRNRLIRVLSLAIVASLTLVIAACGGDDDAADETTTTTEAVSEDGDTDGADDDPEDESADETDDDPAEEDQTEEDPTDDGSTLAGGSFQVGDKTILLDGFFGIVLPDGWSVTSADVPVLSDTPGTETELDPDALDQVLVLNPDSDPQGASFALVHYTHSDKVPELGLFADAVTDLIAADGTEVTGPTESSIGGQESLLYQVRSPEGVTGLLIPMVSGGEYFFIISVVPDKTFAADAGAMVASLSFDPAALHA